MPRKAASVEYLERLIDWCGTRADFCSVTGINQSNLSAYLGGSKRIDWKRLKRCNEQLFGEAPAFIAEIEGYDLRDKGMPKLSHLSKANGMYALFDSAMRVIYYGKATNLYAEVRQTLSRHVAEVRPWTNTKKLKFKDITAYISAYRFCRGDADFRHDVEALCHKFFVNNTFNQNGGTFKRKS
jgi:hypothetical protein